jgi:hypothetical protein
MERGGAEVIEEDKQIISKCVADLAKCDAKAIDSLARGLNINQRIIYELFIEYHRLIYKKMYGDEP